MRADYTFYTEVFHGTAIPQAAFSRLEQRGAEYIDYMTYGRGQTAQDRDLVAVQHAVCAVAERIYAWEMSRLDSDGNPVPGPIQSEKVGDHSATYAVENQGAPQDLYGTARRYLGHTGLLYGGGVTL